MDGFPNKVEQGVLELISPWIRTLGQCFLHTKITSYQLLLSHYQSLFLHVAHSFPQFTNLYAIVFINVWAIGAKTLLHKAQKTRPTQPGAQRRWYPAGWVLVAHEKFHDLVINKLQMFNDYVTMSQITIGLCSLGDGEFFGNVDTLW